MLDQIDRQLRDWIQNKVGVAVSLAVPTKATQKQGVTLYLLELAALPPLSGMHRAPLQFALRYLVTTWAESPEEAHRLLGEIVLLAMESPGCPGLEVDFSPIPPQFWAGLAVPPQPAVVLKVPFRLERPEPVVPVVRTVRSDVVSFIYLHGVVLDGAGQPVVNAEVEYPALQAVTRTDSEGRFQLRDLPLNLQSPRRLRVRTPSQSIEVNVVRPTEPESMVTIRVN